MCLSFVNGSYVPAVEVDISTMATRPIEDLSDKVNTPFPAYMLTRNEYIIYVTSKNYVMILKDGKLQQKFDFRPRFRPDKSYYIIRDDGISSLEIMSTC